MRRIRTLSKRPLPVFFSLPFPILYARLDLLKRPEDRSFELGGFLGEYRTIGEAFEYMIDLLYWSGFSSLLGVEET